MCCGLFLGLEVSIGMGEGLRGRWKRIVRGWKGLERGLSGSWNWDTK
jgi:hypothetical protein